MLRRRFYLAAFMFTIFLLFIRESRIVVSAAEDGIQLCIRSIIPSLFPFLLLSNIVTNSLYGSRIPYLSSITKYLGIPEGMESVIMLGFLSGYPVGAQSINTMYKMQMVTQRTAQRMLAYCNNAGPSFIFGILSSLFAEIKPLWTLWGIHVFSAIVVAIALAVKTSEHCQIPSKQSVNIAECLEHSIKSMAIICAWVVVFRIIISFLNALLNQLPKTIIILLTGLLELTNGCIILNELPNQGLRYIFCALFLGLGGMCVGMQTISVTKDTGIGLYFPGKVLQASLSVLMAYMLQHALFSKYDIYTNWYLPVFAAILVIICLTIIIKLKNRCSISGKMVV